MGLVSFTSICQPANRPCTRSFVSADLSKLYNRRGPGERWQFVKPVTIWDEHHPCSKSSNVTALTQRILESTVVVAISFSPSPHNTIQFFARMDASLSALVESVNSFAQTADEAGRKKIVDTLQSICWSVETPYDSMQRLMYSVWPLSQNLCSVRWYQTEPTITSYYSWSWPWLIWTNRTEFQTSQHGGALHIKWGLTRSCQSTQSVFCIDGHHHSSR